MGFNSLFLIFKVHVLLVSYTLPPSSQATMQLHITMLLTFLFFFSSSTSLDRKMLLGPNDFLRGEVRRNGIIVSDWDSGRRHAVDSFIYQQGKTYILSKHSKILSLKVEIMWLLLIGQAQSVPLPMPGILQVCAF